MARGMDGLDGLLALFDSLPAATEKELKEELPKVGADVLIAQQAAVPVDTGGLKAGLSVQVLDGGKKVRVGLLGTATKTGKLQYPLFYGRFVEFGRRGEVVKVQRRRPSPAARAGKARRTRATDLIERYTLRVRAEAARPFISTPAAEAAAFEASDRLVAFWDGVFARAQGTTA